MLMTSKYTNKKKGINPMTVKKSSKKQAKNNPFSDCGTVTTGSSKTAILSNLRAICNETGKAIGVNELAELMTDNGNPTTKDQVRKGLQKIRKTDFVGYAEKSKEGNLISKDGKEELSFQNTGDKVRGIFYFIQGSK